MATKIYISGNFIIAEDLASRQPYFKLSVDKTYHLRDQTDTFAFFNNTTSQRVDDVTRIMQMGTMPDWNALVTTPADRTVFEFSEIVDGAGVPYPSANAFDQFLNDNLGIARIDISGGGFLTYVATDASLTGDGTPSNPLSVVENNLYEERWDGLTSLVNGAWHVIPTSANPNSLITIVIDSNINNNSCGIRAVGSGLDRRLVIDKDSTSYWQVLTDANGDIEVYTTSTDALIFVEAYHK